MEAPQTNSLTPLATNIEGFMKMTGMGRDSAYNAIRDKRVKVVRVGRKIIVPLWAIEEFLKLEAS
jgi:Helix-turn-helix domain